MSILNETFEGTGVVFAIDVKGHAERLKAERAERFGEDANDWASDVSDLHLKLAEKDIRSHIEIATGSLGLSQYPLAAFDTAKTLHEEFNDFRRDSFNVVGLKKGQERIFCGVGANLTIQGWVTSPEHSTGDCINFLNMPTAKALSLVSKRAELIATNIAIRLSDADISYTDMMQYVPSLVAPRGFLRRNIQGNMITINTELCPRDGANFTHLSDQERLEVLEEVFARDLSSYVPIATLVFDQSTERLKAYNPLTQSLVSLNGVTQDWEEELIDAVYPTVEGGVEERYVAIQRASVNDDVWWRMQREAGAFIVDAQEFLTASYSSEMRIDGDMVNCTPPVPEEAIGMKL